MHSDYPLVRIATRTLSAGIYLPDYHGGYYRGTRFDHAGIIFDLRCEGHQYVGEWFEKHDPDVHDCVCGPVDEFSEIGYNDGSDFLKIGVGILRKFSDAPYDRFARYEVVDPGIRTTRIEKDAVEFTHLVDSHKYAYEYRKSIRLSHEKAELIVNYELKNTGSSSLNCSVYNHNFFTLDNVISGPSLEISFPFSPFGEWREPYSSVELQKNGIRFLRDLEEGEKVFMGQVQGFDSMAEGYGFVQQNTRSGARVEVFGSSKLSHIVFWACPKVACVEPFSLINLSPGDRSQWEIRYLLSAT